MLIIIILLNPIFSCTPLHMSAGHRSKLEVSFLLVEHGARIYENNIHGVRPVNLDPVSYSSYTKDILVLLESAFDLEYAISKETWVLFSYIIHLVLLKHNTEESQFFKLA